MAIGSIKHSRKKIQRVFTATQGSRTRVFNVKVVVQRTSYQHARGVPGYAAAACLGPGPSRSPINPAGRLRGAHNLPGQCTAPQYASSPTMAAEKAIRALGKRGTLNRMSKRKRARFY